MSCEGVGILLRTQGLAAKWPLILYVMPAIIDKVLVERLHRGLMGGGQELVDWLGITPQAQQQRD